MKKLSPVSLPQQGRHAHIVRNAILPVCGWGVIVSLIMVGFTNLYSIKYGTHILSFIKHRSDSFHGPVPHKGFQKAPEFYSFSGDYGFQQFPVKRLNEFESSELHNLVMTYIPRRMRSRASEYIPTLFKFSQQMNVDPLWALSIMWTESHFRPDAKSYVNATGLMQIMPGTVHFLAHKMNRPMGPKLAYKLVRDPVFNMEVGVYYLDYLLKQFDGNYKLATISYNMGPARVRKRLRYGLPVGEKNLYWDKVRRHHGQLTKKLKSVLRITPFPYQLTYVSLPKYWPLSHPALKESRQYDLAERQYPQKRSLKSTQSVF